MRSIARRGSVGYSYPTTRQSLLERFGVLSEQIGEPDQALMYYEAG
jgi:hypothetical protein